MQEMLEVPSIIENYEVMSEALALLACPVCGTDLELTDPQILRCNRGHVYSRNPDNGVLYFVKEEAYAKSFGMQWNIFSREQMDNDQLRDSEYRLRSETGFFPEQIEGKIVLEAGCGMGRFLDIVASDGAALAVGVDLSSAVEAAAMNLADRENVLIVKGDIFSLPFHQKSFDLIISLGVLHHTPSAEQAFRSLVPFVKPGGEIAISVYAATMKPGVGWAINLFRRRFFRTFTRRLPNKLMLWWSLYCVPILWVLDKIPLLRYIRYLFPAVIYKEYPMSWSILDTFDIYATELESRHRPKEVFRWFRQAGLINIDLLDSDDGWVSVRGQVPFSS